MTTQYRIFIAIRTNYIENGFGILGNPGSPLDERVCAAVDANL